MILVVQVILLMFMLVGNMKDKCISYGIDIPFYEEMRKKK